MRTTAIIRRVTMVTAAAGSLAACATVDRAPMETARVDPPSATARPYARQPSRPHARPSARTNQSGQKIGKPYQIRGVWYVPREQPDYNEVGVASWYGEAFHNKTTAIGEPFDMHAVTAAHTTLPLPSIVEVTNLENGRRLRVRVNDRGPFVGNRIIDVSREGARQLGFVDRGLARVRVRYIGPPPLGGREAGVRVASASNVRSPARSSSVAAPTPMARASLSFRDQATFTGSKAPASVSKMELMPTMAAARRGAKDQDAAAYRVQAASFRDETRARRAATRLNKVAPSVVEPVEHDGVTHWRVTVQGTSDQLQAYNLRQQVADAGFADARVVGPF